MPHTHVHFLNIPDLDDDHLTIGYIIAELESCGENNAPAFEIANVLDRLVDAARGHFAREEAMMSLDEYPLLEPHRETHLELIKLLEALAVQVSAGEIKVNPELIVALWEWESRHIDTSDREYAEYFKKQHIGAGSSV
jgi:hemerythrin